MSDATDDWSVDADTLRPAGARRCLLALAAAVATLAASLPAAQAAAYKCVAGGTVTYQQAPCASNQARKDPTVEELNAAERKRRAAAPPLTVAAPPAPIASDFRCDGRRYCSQMTSCAEARHFLAHCPRVQMDGDGNGIPCEKQWCSR